MEAQPVNKWRKLVIVVGAGLIISGLFVGMVLFNKENQNKKTTTQLSPKSTPTQTPLIPPKKLEAILKNVSFQQVSQGVYAKSKGNFSTTVVLDKAVEWKVYTFTVKGKQISIKVPKDDTPPTQEMVEQIYQ